MSISAFKIFIDKSSTSSPNGTYQLCHSHTHSKELISSLCKPEQTNVQYRSWKYVMINYQMKWKRKKVYAVTVRQTHFKDQTWQTFIKWGSKGRRMTVEECKTELKLINEFGTQWENENHLPYGSDNFWHHHLTECWKCIIVLCCCCSFSGILLSLLHIVYWNTCDCLPFFYHCDFLPKCTIKRTFLVYMWHQVSHFY